MLVNNKICKKTQRPIVEIISLRSLFRLEKFTAYIIFLQSFLITCLLQTFLSAAAKIYSQLLKNFRLTNIFRNDLSDCGLIFPGLVLFNFHFPDPGACAQVLPGKTIPSQTQ